MAKVIEVSGIGQVRCDENEKSNYIPKPYKAVLTPYQKAVVYSQGLRYGKKSYVNVESQEIKLSKKRLSKSQKAWRYGYLQAINDLSKLK